MRRQASPCRWTANEPGTHCGSCFWMIYIIGIYHQGSQMAETGTAKIFKHGRSQAVRLPKEFRLPGKEVRVSRLGRGVLLEPINRDWETMQAILEKIDQSWRRRFPAGGYVPNSRQCRSTIVNISMTNDLPRYQRHHCGDQPALRPRCAAAYEGHFTKAPSSAIPSVVLYELWYGIKKSARTQPNTDALDNFLALESRLAFEAEDAEEAGDIRARWSV